MPFEDAKVCSEETCTNLQAAVIDKVDNDFFVQYIPDTYYPYFS